MNLRVNVVLERVVKKGLLGRGASDPCFVDSSRARVKRQGQEKCPTQRRDQYVKRQAAQGRGRDRSSLHPKASSVCSSSFR